MYKSWPTAQCPRSLSLPKTEGLWEPAEQVGNNTGTEEIVYHMISVELQSLLQCDNVGEKACMGPYDVGAFIDKISPACI